MNLLYKPLLKLDSGSEDNFLSEVLDEYLAGINCSGEYKKVDIIKDINFYYNLYRDDNYDLLNILKEYEKTLCDSYSEFLNKFFIFFLYKKNINLINNLSASLIVKKYIYEDFERILNILKNNIPFSYSYMNYIYFSYVKILLLKRFPVGAVNLDSSFFCRSVFFKQTLKEKINFIKYFIISNGSRPYFQMHYNPHKFRKFNRDGWKEVVNLTAELLRSMPEIKGVCGSAWFLDPSLKAISPELCYIREIFELVGGKVFFNGCTEEDRINAFAMSKKRRDAFLAGQYNPCNYLVILPRVRLLENINNLRKY